MHIAINERDGNAQNAMVRGWMVATGATAIRSSINWATWQPSRNSAIDLSGQDAHMADLAGWVPIVYVTGAPPDVASFPGGPYDLVNNDYSYAANFMREVSARYQQVTYWAMGNEPDLKAHLPGRDSWPAQHYANLLRAVYPAIKAGNPQAKLVLGVSAEHPGADVFDMGFTETILQQLGGTRAFDVLDFHYYPAWCANWDDAAHNNYWLSAKARYFRELLARYSYTAELGCSETGRKDRQVDIRQEPASTTAQVNHYWRAFVQALSVDMEFCTLFSVNDIGPEPSESWGIVKKDPSWQKKPSYDGFRAMVQVLTGARYIDRLDSCAADMEVHTLTAEDGRPLTVFWSRDPVAPKVISLPSSGGQLDVYDVWGVAHTVWGTGQVSVRTADPMYAYVHPGSGTPPPPPPEPEPSPIVVEDVQVATRDHTITVTIRTR
jgi:hypothetical protein